MPDSFAASVSHVTNDTVAAGCILIEDAQTDKDEAAQSDIDKKR